MKRMAAMALAAVVLLALASPAFAGWGNDEFYPGDRPPAASKANLGAPDPTDPTVGSSPACANSNVCASGTPDGGHSGDEIDKAYNTPGK